MNLRCPYHKSTLNAVSVADQTVAADGYINFDRNAVLIGCAIDHTAGGNSVALTKQGLYDVQFNADILAAAAGAITVQLVANGEPVDGASATITATETDTANVSFNSLLRLLPNCCAVDNTKSLQVQVTAAATVSNANIVVVKLA